MRLFEDLLDDIDARTIDTAATVADSVFNDPDDPTLYDHQFRIEWFCEDAVSQHDIDRQIEKISHILDACSGVIEYSSVLYLTRDDRLTSLDVPYILEAPTKHYDMFFVFSVLSQFRTVKQLFGFIMKLRSCFDYKNNMGMEYSYMEIISAKDGKWGFPNDEYDTVDTYEALTTTELRAFINNNAKDAKESRGDLNEAYKIATMFFSDKQKVIADFQRYYKDAFDKTIQDWTFRYLEDGLSGVEIFPHTFDKLKQLDIKPYTLVKYTIDYPWLQFETDKLRMYSYPIPLTGKIESLNIGLSTIKKLFTDKDTFNKTTSYKFVYNKDNHRLDFIVFIGVTKSLKPKIVYLRISANLRKSYDRDNRSEIINLINIINALYGYKIFSGSNVPYNYTDDLIAVIKKIDTNVVL